MDPYNSTKSSIFKRLIYSLIDRTEDDNKIILEASIQKLKEIYKSCEGNTPGTDLNKIISGMNKTLFNKIAGILDIVTPDLDNK